MPITLAEAKEIAAALPTALHRREIKDILWNEYQVAATTHPDDAFTLVVCDTSPRLCFRQSADGSWSAFNEMADVADPDDTTPPALTTEQVERLRRGAEAMREDLPLEMWEVKVNGPRQDTITDYIAAADPPTVLALLDERERLLGDLRDAAEEVITSRLVPGGPPGPVPICRECYRVADQIEDVSECGLCTLSRRLSRYLGQDDDEEDR